ncbi:MAG TPA: imidazole glycerol phosphate synthase subunit HisH [Dehalococcoidia bacterium]|nr:imidazole glycerol phosphate synthase subunit HisH [Dehalococcoidia bacterium]
MGKRVCILDYGSGNVRSVANLLRFLKIDFVLSNRVEDIETASHIVLPGVGSFGSSMEKIQDRIPLEALGTEVLIKQKPFLGICVGMQVLAETGTEFGLHKGLGWIPGRVRKFADHGLPIPNIGWNTVLESSGNSLLGEHQKLDFYFVHSFVFEVNNQKHAIGTTEYGEIYASIVRRDNIVGVQFHPEKSQKAGMILISNFMNMR